MAEALATAASAGTAFSNVAVIRPVGGKQNRNSGSTGSYCIRGFAQYKSLFARCSNGRRVRSFSKSRGG